VPLFAQAQALLVLLPLTLTALLLVAATGSLTPRLPRPDRAGALWIPDSVVLLVLG
jgi:hypothetical protein